MAIEKQITGVDMKTTLNYGDNGEGKIVKKTKTYGDVREDVTDEAFFATAKAIAAMQEPIMERKQKVTSEEVMEV